ncbi:MAG: helix-turn-helix domain-containing protein [Bacteroidota bacterium]|nr:helix-turn-helix domain-containing protein [Bacteroidota bacterium]
MMSLADQVVALINETQTNVFLTGKAGTGKTTLLRKITQNTHKNTIVVAPTGIAALNAQGVTIHSLFQLPFASFIPTLTSPPIANDFLRFENRLSLQKHFKMHKNKREIIKNLELLIVDEVSMVRCDVLDAMDFMLQHIRGNKKPFGGVQLLFIGDLYQLPPVVKNDEWNILKEYYKSIFFFEALVIKNNPLVYIELDKIYRQSDQKFISFLNNLRDNKLTIQDRNLLKKHIQLDFIPEQNKNYITLTTHNSIADNINQREINLLQTKEYTYHADIVGDFPEHIYPIEKAITLKIGARVMFIKNDLSLEKLYYNGKMGTVTQLSEDQIMVQLDEGDEINVERYEWENIRYKLNEITKDIEEEKLGTYTQYPLRLAWAITIHKSQGLTFDRAIIDINKVFASGQAYVAFSRLRSLDGLILLSDIPQNNIENSQDIIDYAQNKTSKEALQNIYANQRGVYIIQLVKEAFYLENIVHLFQTHRQSYLDNTSKKALYKDWAIELNNKITALGTVAHKFQKQIVQISTQQNWLDSLHDRFQQAYDYFMPKILDFWYEVLKTKTEISTIKKTKEFYEELTDIENALIAYFKKLHIGKLALDAVKDGKELNKLTIDLTDIIKKFRLQVEHKVTEYLKEKQIFVTEINSTTKEKKEKKPTHIITLELWKNQKSIDEISKERMLTEDTICKHISKLIQLREINIDELFNQEQLAQLTEVFDNTEDISLTNIKETLNDDYSWGLIRIFKDWYIENKI